MARKVASAFLFAALATTPLGARTTALGPPESVKFLYQQGRYTEARDYGLPLVWDDIVHPEPLYCVAQSMAKLGDKDQAAAFFHILLRVLDEDPKAKADSLAAAWRTACQTALKSLDIDFKQDQRKHREAAKGTRFT